MKVDISECIRAFNALAKKLYKEDKFEKIYDYEEEIIRGNWIIKVRRLDPKIKRELNDLKRTHSN